MTGLSKECIYLLHIRRRVDEKLQRKKNLPVGIFRLVHSSFYGCIKEVIPVDSEEIDLVTSGEEVSEARTLYQVFCLKHKTKSERFGPEVSFGKRPGGLTPIEIMKIVSV